MDQVQQGAHPKEVALALGLRHKTVYGWLAKYREGARGPAGQAGAGAAAAAGVVADALAVDS